MARRRGPKEADLARRFGQNLIVLRGRVGLSQLGTAERAGLTRSEVGLLEHGRRVPQLDTVVKLAGAVEVAPCELLAGMAWKLDPPKKEGSS
jgi:transcriptional regulator with XRE-family HTH domain